MAVKIVSEPRISVGIMEGRDVVEGRFNGAFSVEGIGPVSGLFSAASDAGKVVLLDGQRREAGRSASLRIAGGAHATFDLFRVTIGQSFHWERKEDHTFMGDLVLIAGKGGGVTAVNDVPVEDYLESVVASEMSASAPVEFLKCHAILSRSWVLSVIARKGRPQEAAARPSTVGDGGEVMRWYGGEDHALFDVCADDHCQRYHGLTRITSEAVRAAVRETRGMALTFGGEICDARYSKACGGLTEEFRTAWADIDVPYLACVSDGPAAFARIATEGQAGDWIGSRPDAYCNMQDEGLLATILPAFDRETTSFFRWTVEYTRGELEEILREKSGFDPGRLRAIQPLERGPSGRIRRLRIVGSRAAIVVGKELEIRRWLSRTHLYSSAFTVRTIPAGSSAPEHFVFNGAGWGHGVGLCQIGAAVMASRGFSAEEIMAHYFPGAALSRLY
jgi:peptidoglycan hydrolase-like amidase